MAPPQQLAPGDVFQGRFEVLRAISCGGVGAVYDVRDARTGRRRALKVLRPEFAVDADARERLALEARITAGLRSAHVVEVIDAGCDDASGCPYVVMDLLEGDSLGARLASGAVPLAESVALLRQIARGVDALHRAGVVHRDVKPENVVITTAPDGSALACLVDLGIAKIVTGGPSPTTRALGTPLYMAPEQIEGDGDLDGRADVYAFGHLAFTMLVGRAYFDEEHRRGALYRVLLDATRGLPEPARARAERLGAELPPGFDSWFEEVTARDRRRRPRTAGEAVLRLEKALAGGAAADRRVTRGVAAGAALVALALVVTAAPPRAPRSAVTTPVNVTVAPAPARAEPIAPATEAVPAAAPPAPPLAARARPPSSPRSRSAPRPIASTPPLLLPQDPTDVR